MGKSLRDIVNSVKEALTGFNITDDTLYDDMYLQDKIIDVRNTLIKQEIEAGKNMDAYFQFICCLDIKCLETTCTVGGITVGDGDFKYYIDLPKLNENIGKKAIKYIGLSDLKTPASLMSIQGYISLGGSRYTSNLFSGTRIENRIYLQNITPGLTVLCGLLLLDNPQESCDFNKDSNFPVTDVYKLELLVKKDILSTFGINPDQVSDSMDSPTSANEAKVVSKNE